jgi:adenine-specific DNA-methyltransferase
MPEDYTKKLQTLLRKLFQFESADLDFGIYRIMNRKRDVIEKFIEKDLIAAVDSEFGKTSLTDKAQILAELEALAGKLGIGVDDDPAAVREMAKKVPALQPLITEFEQKRTDLRNLEGKDEHKAEVFNHIYQFFSRYYDNGDFMSMRRYSAKQKFSVPYNGEEVLLHWANKDQYYIKTGEYFFNYTFRIGEYAVRFQIVQAETAMNNTKAENRFFILKGGEGNVSYIAETKELIILFEYRALIESEKASIGTRNVQDTLNEQAETAILAAVTDAGLKAGLTREKDRKTPLTKHLATYAKRNTTDYFIHKDLDGFLEQELDFYIKNEMFDLDDLGTEKEEPVDQYLNRVRVMKAISLKIIAFLAQIEDFQRKLFEKKKFVLSTNYCLTLDRVPAEFYLEIAKNTDQITEWKALYGIGEPGGQATLAGMKGNVIDVEFLKTHPYLVLDTKFFPQEFKDRLLATFEDLDDAIGGLLVKSENWQALNLLQERYRNQVKCIYIDPPYNTGIDGFDYKDNYQHSTWLSMMIDRLHMGSIFLSNKGTYNISIDDTELPELRILLNKILSSENFLQQIIWKKRGGAPNDKIIGSIHEYILLYSKIFQSVELIPRERTSNQLARYKNPDNHPKGPWAPDNLMANVKGGRYVESLYYPIINPITGEEHYPSSQGNWRFNKEKIQKLLLNNEIYFGEDGHGRPKLKRFLCDVKEGVPYSTIWDYLPHNNSATNEIEEYFGTVNIFDTPKPIGLIREIINLNALRNDLILDFFAGSGTTGDAVLRRNKENKENLRYMLIEIEKYFDAVTKNRIQKVMYSSEWKGGKPQNTDGISHIFKYLTLEQYEDALNNIEFQEGGTIQKTLMDMEGYVLRYMLDFETRESPCRMNVVKLEHPFDYTLRITKDSELHNETVDLVETFNYLLGLKVKRVRTFSENGTTYRVVHGETLAGQATTIIWRTTTGLDLKKDKEFIDEKILTDPYLKAERFFINGDFHVVGALPIEPEFQRLMRSPMGV